MLRRLLAITKNAGLHEFYLAVEQNNPASVKTIIKNSGSYHRSFEYKSEMATFIKPYYKYPIKTKRVAPNELYPSSCDNSCG